MNKDLNDQAPTNELDDLLNLSEASRSDSVRIVEMTAAKSSLELSQEVEGILDELKQNRFRECVAVVLGEDMEIKENFQVKESSMVFGQEVDELSSYSKLSNEANASDDKFLYDTSSDEDLSEDASVVSQTDKLVPHIPQKSQSTLMDQQVGRLAPWKEIFPPLYVPHMSPPKPLYWTSTALKILVLATNDLKENSFNWKP